MAEDRITLLANLGVLIAEAEARGDARAVATLRDALGALAVSFAAADALEQLRAGQRERTRRHREKTAEVEPTKGKKRVARHSARNVTSRDDTSHNVSNGTSVTGSSPLVPPPPSPAPSPSTPLNPPASSPRAAGEPAGALADARGDGAETAAETAAEAATAAVPAFDLAPFVDAWRAVFGGDPPGGRFGKVLRRLVVAKAYGQAEVLRRWGIYLAAKGDYATPEDFAAKWDRYAEAPAPGASGAGTHHPRAVQFLELVTRNRLATCVGEQVPAQLEAMEARGEIRSAEGFFRLFARLDRNVLRNAPSPHLALRHIEETLGDDLLRPGANVGGAPTVAAAAAPAGAAA